jgi:hypothetical protein
MPDSSYFGDSFVVKMPSAALGNVNAPTFSGISSLVADDDGSLVAGWAAATGSAQAPISYAVYVAFGSVSAGALFVDANIIGRFDGLSARFYTLPDNTTFLNKDETYTVGVRAVSANGISETNTVIDTEVCLGVNLNDLELDVTAIKKLAKTILGNVV